jgi:hypothetical protein
MALSNFQVPNGKEVPQTDGTTHRQSDGTGTIGSDRLPGETKRAFIAPISE